MSTKVFVSQYIEGPDLPQSRPVVFGWDDQREILRHACALFSPRVQWRTRRRWLVLEAAVFTSLVATAITFLASAATLPMLLLLLVDVGLVLTLVAGLFADAARNYRRQRNAQDSRSISKLAFRLTDYEFCCALRQAEKLDINDHVNNGSFQRLEALTPHALQPGDIILVEAGQFIYANGVILCGIAVIDESAITGTSTHVLREAGGDCAVMHDSLVVAGRILVEVAPPLGHPLDWITHSMELTPINGPASKQPFDRL